MSFKSQVLKFWMWVGWNEEAKFWMDTFFFEESHDPN